MADDELILNRYRPLGEAGRGGFGTVQLAWDTRIQRRVAVKSMPIGGGAVGDSVLPPWMTPDDTDDEIQNIDDILREGSRNIAGLEEARTAALLQDPNIVGVLDFEVQGSTAYLIMEYVDGITLTELMRDWGDYVDGDIVAAVLDGVAHALCTAHENAVLHLDIKPDNILINHQGLVKVTDFGLSELSNAGGFGSAAGGTIGYMPPEQMNREDLDQRCDEWALASVVYEMIAGENPFWAKDIPQALKTIEEAELVLPHLCMPGLPPEADDVLFYALDPEREERYETVADFAGVLEPLLGDAREGTVRLAELVALARDDEADDAIVAERIPLIDRVSPRVKGAIFRLLAGFGVGALAYVSLRAMPQVGGAGVVAFWGLLALVVLAAVLVPHIGTLAGVGVFAAALIVNGAIAPGVLLILAVGAWWMFAGRNGKAQSVCALVPTLFGAFGMGNLAPLLAGYFLNLREAAVTTGFAALLAVLLAGAGAESVTGWVPFNFVNNLTSNYLAMLLIVLTRPQTWLVALAWMASAAITAACCTRGSRMWGLIACAVTAVIFVAVLVANAYLTVGALYVTPAQVASVAFPLAVNVMLVCAGVPAREGDEE